MDKKHGFTRMNLSEFEQWISKKRVGRTILKVQQHHTYIPSYIHFSGTNHFERQLAMKIHHVSQNGWADIGQHFTIFPDGDVLTGRSLESVPAGIRGHNADAICIENFGNFDIDGDSMTAIQKINIVAVTAALCRKFNLFINSESIVYHHWFRLDNGFRNDGAGGNKSCPGTNFFGGNKVNDFDKNFAPLVKARISGGQIKTDTTAIQKYVSVTADALNVRVRPISTSAKAKDRTPVQMGAILRVYEEQNNWFKISNSAEHWVSGRFTIQVERATVNATVLNVRTGPGSIFPKQSSISKGQEVFIYAQKDGWYKIDSGERWVSRQYLSLAS